MDDSLRARLLRRFASPSFLLLALLMFPLPWVQIQCVQRSSPSLPPPGKQSNPTEIVRSVLPRWNAVTILSQSGRQAAIGDCSVNPESNEPAKLQAETVAAMRPSPLMLAWPLVVLGGILTGVLLPAGRVRRWAVDGCAGAALVLLVAQNIVGFPLDHAMQKLFAEELAQQAQEQLNSREPGIYLTYTPWYLLAWLGTGGPLVLTGVAWWRERRRRAETAAAPQPCEPESPVESP